MHSLKCAWGSSVQLGHCRVIDLISQAHRTWDCLASRVEGHPSLLRRAPVTKPGNHVDHVRFITSDTF